MRCAALKKIKTNRSSVLLFFILA